MSKTLLEELSAKLVAKIEHGGCLDHCMRGVDFAARLPKANPPIKVHIVQAIVDGHRNGIPSKILHCWIEIEQEGRAMVMDAIAEHPISAKAAYYAKSKPTDAKRFTPERMLDLLEKAGRAEWFDRSAAEVEQYTGPPIKNDTETDDATERVSGDNKGSKSGSAPLRND